MLCYTRVLTSHTEKIENRGEKSESLGCTNRYVKQFPAINAHLSIVEIM